MADDRGCFRPSDLEIREHVDALLIAAATRASSFDSGGPPDRVTRAGHASSGAPSSRPRGSSSDDVRTLEVLASVGSRDRIRVTISAASATGTRLGDTIRRAEAALQRAKAAGGDRAEAAV